MNFVNDVIYGAANGFIYAAVALALVLIWRSTRIVNFAQGGMVMITTFVAWDLVVKHNQSFWVGLAVAMAAGLVLGAVVERVLIRPVENGPPLNPVIVALGLLLVLEGSAGMIWGSNNNTFPAQYSLIYYHAGHQVILFNSDLLFVVVSVSVIAALLYVLFQHTSLGLRMRASAFNPEVARLLGVPVGQLLTLGWALAAVVGAVAGVLIAGIPGNYVSPNGFDGLLILGFTAAVIGGLDSPIGAIVGGLLLGVALQVLDGYVSNDIDSFFVLLLLLVVLMVRPRGLFTRHAERRV